MQKTRRKYYKKNNKSKRKFGGGLFSIEQSPNMLGIPVNGNTIMQITGMNKDDREINKYLEEKKTQIRVQSIDGSNGLRILGYNIENVSHINGPLIPASELLRELRIKRKSFKNDIKNLNPELNKITLSLYEADDDEIEVDIDKLIPYLFEISSV